MEAPQNLVDAVNRIKPRVILVLDTNVIMKFPWLDRLKTSASGPFLLVVPILVDGELVRLRKDKDEQTRKKASRAHWVTSKLYKQGNPPTGIELGNDRWLITVSAPASAGFNVLEDEQARSDKGKVDAALLRMTATYTQDFPNVSTLFVTEENDLRRIADISDGLSACKLSELRSSGTFENISREIGPSRLPDVDEAVAALLDADNERQVRIAITLEELRSESDDLLVARGSGRLTYDGNRFPFRWTFPYQNLAIYNLLEDDVPVDTESAVMPLENVDFMGADNEIPEGVSRFVCSMLEDAYASQDLQSPITKVRASMLFYTHMGTTRGGALIYDSLSDMQKQGKKEEGIRRYEELRISHDRHVKSLYDGSAKSVSETYRSAFQSSENLDSFWTGGTVDDEYDEDEYDWDNWNVELSLMWFLDEALSAWTVGETREAEYTYRPFAWPEDEIEAVDGENDLEEEAFVDDEDDSEEESA